MFPQFRNCFLLRFPYSFVYYFVKFTSIISVLFPSIICVFFVSICFHFSQDNNYYYDHQWQGSKILDYYYYDHQGQGSKIPDLTNELEKRPSQ